MCRTRIPYDLEQVRRLGETTIAYYDRFARAFWDGTRHHDVSQNYAAFLNAVESDPPYSILDLGCGPGRDLIAGDWNAVRDYKVTGSNSYSKMVERFWQDLLAVRKAQQVAQAQSTEAGQ